MKDIYFVIFIIFPPLFAITTFFIERINSKYSIKLQKQGILSDVFFKNRFIGIIINFIVLYVFSFLIYSIFDDLETHIRVRIFLFSGIFYLFLQLIVHLLWIPAAYKRLVRIENEKKEKGWEIERIEQQRRKEKESKESKELKELQHDKWMEEIIISNKKNNEIKKLKSDAISALMNLGWKKKACEEKINQIMDENKNINSIEELIKAAFKR